MTLCWDRLHCNEGKINCNMAIWQSEMVDAQITYPAISIFIHVPFHFASILHEIVHAPVSQGCWVGRWKYCLHTAREADTTHVNKVSNKSKTVYSGTRLLRSPMGLNKVTLFVCCECTMLFIITQSEHC